jgi:hypothetical protein
VKVFIFFPCPLSASGLTIQKSVAKSNFGMKSAKNAIKARRLQVAKPHFNVKNGTFQRNKQM